MKPRSLLVVMFFGLLSPVFSQVTGRLSGSVTDPTASAVPGAAIKLLLQGSNAPAYSTAATSEGLFVITGINPGVYDMTIEAPGFVTRKETNILIDPGRENSLPPIQLSLGSLS